jgi:hypothetical protein
MRTNRIFGLVLVGTVAAIGALLVGNVRIFHFGHFGAAAPAAVASRLVPGTRAAFAYLAKQTSNSCDLQPATVQSYPDRARIQGSCCSPMDWDHYRAQVRGLRMYSGMRQIPRDPYDISAALAKELFTDEASMHLTAAQQAVYNQAMSISPEKGPCCCKCWRWHALAGLSKYLIVRRHFGARQVASVVGLVDGCGGKA